MSYRSAGSPVRAGLEVDGAVVDCTAAATAARLSEPEVFWRAREVLRLASGDAARLSDAALELSASGRESIGPNAVGVTLEPPIPDPGKIVCIGLNYRGHAAETGLPLPETPVVFAKFPNALTGPASPVILPPESSRVDYEGEVAVVIGRRSRRVQEVDALDHVWGAMAFNDVTARDLQFATSQWTTGKTPDSFAPCGPSLVSLDELGALEDLRITTRLGEQLLQEAALSDMVFSVPELIAFLSRYMTLEPGDIIATGTPAGVGFTRDPPVFLRDGDSIEVEVTRLGCLKNPVVNEPPWDNGGAR